MSYKVTVNTTSSPYKVDVTTGGEVKAKFYADQAAESAAEALASEQASALSESNASSSESSASASASSSLASASSASASANTATAQALIATTKASEASTSANNALASEQASALSELDAETAATQATAARDEIVNKIDFTGAVEGDIFRVNSLGVAVKINETEFLKSKVPFLNSPLAGLVDLDNVFAWDSFSRANTASTLMTDSGHSYVQITGTSGLRIQSNFAYKNNASDIIGVNTGFGSVRFVNSVRIRPANSFNSFVIGKDANNYILYELNPIFSDGIRVSIVVAGVATLLSAQAYSVVFGSVSLILANSAIVTFIIDLIRPSEGGMVFRINSPTIPQLNQYVDLSSYRVSEYPNASDIAFVGWGFGNNSTSTRISSWSVSNIIS